MTDHDIKLIEARRLDIKNIEALAWQYGLLRHKAISVFGEGALLSLALSRMWYGRAIRGATRMIADSDVRQEKAPENAMVGIVSIKERLKILIDAPLPFDIEPDPTAARALDRAEFYLEEAKMLFGSVVGAWKNRKAYATAVRKNAQSSA